MRLPINEISTIMPKITFIEHDGTVHEVNAEVGETVMEAALRGGVSGIVAECGGSCMCATCHVYVRDDQMALCPEMEPGEDAMLDGAASPRQPNSRLSCQLVISPKMEGLVVRMPETQI